MTDILDLGSLDGPLLIFGGPYSNLQATQALRRYADAAGFTPDRVICTGDVVAYCADPAETVDEIRDWGCRVLMGNCEESLAQSAADCGCGFEDGTACAVLSDQWYRYADKRLGEDARHWMGALPRLIRFQFAGRHCAVVHGAASGINRFVFASQVDESLLPEFELAGAELIIAGHSGIPFTRSIGKHIWHNAGVIGMPANDGTAAVWFSTMTATPELRIEHHRLDYDAELAREQMLQSGLDNGYATALTSGLWPSEDVLPASEKAARGQPLEVSSLAGAACLSAI